MQLAVILEKKKIRKRQTRNTRLLSLNLPIADCFNKTVICDTCSSFFCIFLSLLFIFRCFTAPILRKYYLKITKTTHRHMTTLALSDESAENLQCDTKNTKERKNNNFKSPNNNLLRQYASIIKMLVCVCVCKQLKMNGQKKKRSNKQTATATATATAKRHLNDTFCGEKHNRHTKWSQTHR